MTVTEGKMAWGEFSIPLKPNTPSAIVDLLNNSWFGLIRVYSSRVNVTQVGTVPGLYSGVVLDRPDRFTVGGAGPAWYLGEASEVNSSSQLGPISASVQTLDGSTNGSLTDWVNVALGLSAAGITVGTVGGPASSTKKKGSFTRNSSKTILDAWICPKFGVEYRVNPDFTLDIGYQSSVFPWTSPYPMAIRRGGRDLSVDGMNASQLSMTQSVRNQVQRVFSIIDNPSTYKFANSGWPYKDPQGNALARTLSQSGPNANTTLTEAQDDAQADADQTIAELAVTTREVSISTVEYDVTTRVVPGGFIYVYDVEEGLFDQANVVNFRGRVTYPVQLRVEEVTWPLTRGMSVFLDDSHNGNLITELTRYVDFEAEGDTTSLKVGAPPKTLGNTVFTKKKR